MASSQGFNVLALCLYLVAAIPPTYQFSICYVVLNLIN